MASSQLCSKGRCWAMSTDGGNFAGKHRKLTALINPENSGIRLPPQVFMYKPRFPDVQSSALGLFVDALDPEGFHAKSNFGSRLCKVKAAALANNGGRKRMKKEIED